ncbi:MAG TPA: hypothetical protein VH277_20240 [Gemmatimonadaceae bacterium]|nr:hypothetical protein [Gemmatimonadaceae bacterium]
MRILHLAAFATLATLSTLAAACGDQNATAPRPLPPGPPNHQSSIKGTGLSLDIVPNVTLPLGLGGSLVVNQAVISNIQAVELLGQVVGLDVTGTLSGTQFDAAGKLVGATTDPFTSELSITSSGPGQCSLVTLNLSNLTVNASPIADVTLPANVTVKGSGAVGSLLCNLGSALSGLTSGLSGSGGAQGLVNALNNQIGG